MHLLDVVNTLKERRVLLGVTQEHLSQISGIGLRTIKALETGNSNPTFETLQKLADVLGLEISLDVKKQKI